MKASSLTRQTRSVARRRFVASPTAAPARLRLLATTTTRPQKLSTAAGSSGPPLCQPAKNSQAAADARDASRFMMDAQVPAGQFEERASVQQQDQGKGNNRNRNRNREKQISMALSKLLRHQATNAGITLDKEGYAPLDKVLQWGPLRTLNVTVQEVMNVTADNEKQRFAMRPAADTTGAAADETDASRWLIRANQGHSIKMASEALLRPITDDSSIPPVVVHGTYFAFWPRIVASGGLRRMGRNHVHCSVGVPGDGDGNSSSKAVMSGMRADAELLVYVDVRRSLEEEAGGLKWWVSENGVVLTEGLGEEGLVPLRFFKEVVGRRADDGVGTLVRDGEVVAELPEGVRSRPPPAKHGAKGRGGGGRGRGRGRGRGA